MSYQCAFTIVMASLVLLTCAASFLGQCIRHGEQKQWQHPMRGDRFCDGTEL